MSEATKRERAFTLRGAEHEAAPVGELRLRIGAGGFERGADALREAGARFVSVFKTGAPEATMAGVFALHGELIMLSAPLDGAALRRLGDSWPAASWAARELVERNAPEAAREPFLTAPDASRLDAGMVDQPLTDRGRAAFAEGLVVARLADRVGVPLDDDVVVGRALQELRQRRQLGGGLRRDLVRAGREVDVV